MLRIQKVDTQSNIKYFLSTAKFESALAGTNSLKVTTFCFRIIESKIGEIINTV